MGEKKIILSPSLLSADFYAAGRQLEALETPEATGCIWT